MPYFSNEMYKHQKCVYIGKGCFLAESSCFTSSLAYTTNVTSINSIQTEANSTNLEWILVVTFVALVIVICAFFNIFQFYRNKHLSEDIEMQRQIHANTEYDKNVMVKSAELTSSYNTDEEDNPAKKRKIKTNKSKSCSLPPLEQLPVLTTVKQVLHQSTDTLTLQRSHRKSLLGSVTSLQPRSDSPETVKEGKKISILGEIKYVTSKYLQSLLKNNDDKEGEKKTKEREETQEREEKSQEREEETQEREEETQ